MIAQDTLIPLTAAYRYDALNRLRQKSTFKNYQNVLSYSTSYTYDKMGNILTLNRFASNAPMDSLRYHYYANSNKLAYVNDAVAAGAFSNDIDNQNPNNYAYDPTGNLIKDHSEGLEIKWTHYGKVKQIKKNNNNLLSFQYDATGNRSVKDNRQTNEKQIYIKDAQGNVMAVYQTRHDSLFLDELHLYGSSRLGMIKERQFLTKKFTGGTPPPPQISPVYTLKLYNFGKKRYELADWLGNVRVVINDKKTPQGTNASDMTYAAQTISVSDYYPGGSIMPGRNSNSNLYRYKYQGSESDDEITGVTGAHFTTYFREGDTRLLRWWSNDPKTAQQPWQSPYSYMDGNPIWYNDVLGDSARARISRSMRKELGITRKEAKNYTPEQIAGAFRQEYGIEVETRNGWLHYAGESETQPQDVSETAKDMWTTLLGDQYRSRIGFKFTMNKKGVDLGHQIGRKAVIDVGDFNADFSFKGADYGSIPVRTANLPRVLEHEFLAHGIYGLFDDYPAKYSNPNYSFNAARESGETVDFVNIFRKELGLPIRANYGAANVNKQGKVDYSFILFQNNQGQQNRLKFK